MPVQFVSANCTGISVFDLPGIRRQAPGEVFFGLEY